MISNTPRYEGIKNGEEHECDCEHCDVRWEADSFLCEECEYEYEDYEDMKEICRLHEKCVSCGNKFSDNSGKIKQLKYILETRELK